MDSYSKQERRMVACYNVEVEYDVSYQVTCGEMGGRQYDNNEAGQQQE